MPEVRRAAAADGAAIVSILRSELQAGMLPFTIFGCAGFERWLHDSIGLGDRSGSVWYVLAGETGEPAGCAEVRPLMESLFVNHAYIRPSARGVGVGPGLIHRALADLRGPHHRQIELDVFEDNVSVLSGYHTLGFRDEFVQAWIEVPGESFPTECSEPFVYSGLVPADRLHDAYGFSELGLRTRRGSFRIGRLGPRLFRATDAAVLTDPTALAALRTLDPDRNLLCIDRADAFDQVTVTGAKELARAVRMTADLDPLMKRLSRFARF